MENPNSSPHKNRIEQSFNNFIESINKLEDKIQTSNLAYDIHTLEKQAELFLNDYKQLIELNVIKANKINIIKKHFQRISLAVDIFSTHITYLKDNSKSIPDFTTIFTEFQKDLQNYIHYLAQLIKSSTQSLQSFLNQKSPLLFTKLILDLQIFNLAVNIKNQPFYKMEIFEDFNFGCKIHSTKSQIVNITSSYPCKNGDVSMIPIFLISRILNSKQKKFVIVIEQSEGSILRIGDFYSSILDIHKGPQDANENKSDEHDDDDDDDDDDKDDKNEIKVFTSLNDLIEISNGSLNFPVISVLTPFDALKLLKSVASVSDFVSKSVFVINNASARTFEADIFAQQIKCHFSKSQDLQLVTLSKSRDERFLAFVGCQEELSVAETTPDFDKYELMMQILNLRSLGIKLENEITNLPSDVDQEKLDISFSLLANIGFIEKDESRELSEMGREAVKYSSVSPFFALATSKFKENPRFAFLCSLIIENYKSLVIDPFSNLICNHFNCDSDVVTLLTSLHEVIQKEEEEEEEINLSGFGFSNYVIKSIYLKMEKSFDGIKGKEAVIDAIDWACKQEGGIVAMVDKFVSLLDQNEFLNKRKGKLSQVFNSSLDSEINLVYKMSDAFESNGNEKIINCNKRPGWLGLQSPSNIIALSYNEQNCSLIIHRDKTVTDNFPCAISLEVSNPSINNLFFIPLLEGYLSDRIIERDFLPIYNMQEIENDSLSSSSSSSSFLFTMTEVNEKNFINFCPRNKETKESVIEGIPRLISLMPFVPCSIISMIEDPLCAIEIVGYGTLENYCNNIHLINDPCLLDTFAYPINKSTLDYAAQNIEYLKKDIPLIRFAITGESFCFKCVNGKQIENDLIYPDIDPSMKSVFDQFHASHLVLLVDKSLIKNLKIVPLSWLPLPNETIDVNDTEENRAIISYASKLMNKIGYIKRSSDVFFVTLGEGNPEVEIGSIPEYLKVKLTGSSSNDNAIRCSIHTLFRSFVQKFTWEQKLDGKIELEKLSSTDGWTDYPMQIEEQIELCNEISKEIVAHFNLDENDVSTNFVGKSMLKIQIQNLNEKLVSHKISTKIYDDKYQPCQADYEIENILNKNDKIDFNISQIVHEPTIRICVQNNQKLGLNAENFKQNVLNVANKFGFLLLKISDYIEVSDFGYIEVDLIGIQTGIAFATMITEEFHIINEKTLYMKHSIESIMGLARTNKRLTNSGRCSIMPLAVTKESLLNQVHHLVKDIENDTTCMYMCDEEYQSLPHTLFCYKSDGTELALSICKKCQIEFFRCIEDFNYVIDPKTHLINIGKINKLTIMLNGFALYIKDSKDSNEIWPQIPLGQYVWALMNDPDILGYCIKFWFTINFMLSVRKAKNFFISCPNHPNDIQQIRKGVTCCKCAYCDMIFCQECFGWHRENEECKMPDIRRCPNCKHPAFIASGFKGLKCPCCDKWWCYECGNKSPIFHTSQEMYAHFTNGHT